MARENERYNEHDDRIYTRRSHPSQHESSRWEPETRRRLAPSSFDYREDYREASRGTERGGDFHAYNDYMGSGDGYSRGPTYNTGSSGRRFGDLSRYSGSDDYYDNGGERWAPERSRRNREKPSREELYRARRYEEHEGPGEGMMDLVRSFFGVGPKNYRRADGRIEEEANEILYRDHHVDATDIEVSVKDAVITLKGSVPDRWSKTRAEDLLEEIPGVHDVQNQLRVDRARGYREEESLLRYAGRSADDAASATGTSALTGGAGMLAGRAEGSDSVKGAEEYSERDGTFGSTGLPGMTTTGGFNNQVVVHPVDDEKSA